MLLVARDDLVVRPSPSPATAIWQPRVVESASATSSAEVPSTAAIPLADSLPQLDHLLDVRLAAPALRQVALEPCPKRVDGRLRERAVRAGVEVGVALEDGELGAGLLVSHSTIASTGAWSESTRPSMTRRSSGHADGPSRSSSPRTRIWSMLPASGGEKPSAAGDTRFASPATIERSGASARTRSNCARSPSMWKFDDRHALELDRVGDATQLRLAHYLLAEVPTRGYG